MALLLLLTPMMMLNASLPVILCVGQDGHVAIELLVGDRCSCEVRPPNADAGTIDAAARPLEERGLACSDFVVPVGAGGVRAAPVTSQMMIDAVAATSPWSFPAALAVTESLSPASPPDGPYPYLPLDGIILRV